MSGLEQSGFWLMENDDTKTYIVDCNAFGGDQLQAIPQQLENRMHSPHPPATWVWLNVYGEGPGVSYHKLFICPYTRKVDACKFHYMIFFFIYIVKRNKKGRQVNKK